MRLFLLFLFFLPALASAQEGRQVSCRFLGFGANGGPAEVVAVGKESAEIVCPLPGNAISKPVACIATENKINFLTSGDKKPAAVASIPAGMSAVILVFVKSASKEGAPEGPAWRVFVIDDSAKKFPDGGVFVANFSSQEVRFVIGEHKGMLKAGGANGYEMPKERNDFNMSPVIFELLQGTRWVKASESALRFLPGMRYLIISYLDPTSGRPRINTVKDMTPSPAEEKKAG